MARVVSGIRRGPVYLPLGVLGLLLLFQLQFRGSEVRKFQI